MCPLAEMVALPLNWKLLFPSANFGHLTTADAQRKKGITILKRIIAYGYHDVLRLLYIMCEGVTVYGT
jgi:hypothetical protein